MDVCPIERKTRRRPRTGREGYSLVILVVAAMVLTIATSAALPVWTTHEQREREEELIFRGLQYAEAIRVFQVRHGRLPIRLEELLEVEPRSIRQLWPNPMRDDGRWGLIAQTAAGQAGGGRRVGGAAGAPHGVPSTQGGGRGDSEDNQPPGVILSAGEGEPQQSQVPIAGVYDPEGLDTIKIWMGAENTAEWRFTIESLQPQRVVTDAGAGQPAGLPAGPAGGQPWPANAGRIGRPFPEGVQVQSVPLPQQGRDLNPQNPRGGARPLQPDQPVQPGQPLQPGGQPGGQPDQPRPGIDPTQPTQPTQPDPQGGGGGRENR